MCGCVPRTAIARLGCCTSLLYGTTGVSGNPEARSTNTLSKSAQLSPAKVGKVRDLGRRAPGVADTKPGAATTKSPSEPGNATTQPNVPDRPVTDGDGEPGP